MLRISKLADYATVVMVHLASHEAAVNNAKAIAEATRLAVPTVSKLLKLLANADLLQSQRGVKGGYFLARSASNISVADIIIAVEGAAGLTECSHHQGECSIEDVCSIQGNWRLISRAIHTALDSVKLSQLAKSSISVASINVSDIQGLNKEAIQ